MKYSDWMEGVSNHIKNDPLWELKVYRKALFVSDLAWHDKDGKFAAAIGD